MTEVSSLTDVHGVCRVVFTAIIHASCICSGCISERSDPFQGAAPRCAPSQVAAYHGCMSGPEVCHDYSGCMSAAA